MVISRMSLRDALSDQTVRSYPKRRADMERPLERGDHREIEMEEENQSGTIVGFWWILN